MPVNKSLSWSAERDDEGVEVVILALDVGQELGGGRGRAGRGGATDV